MQSACARTCRAGLARFQLQWDVFQLRSAEPGDGHGMPTAEALLRLQQTRYGQWLAGVSSMVTQLDWVAVQAVNPERRKNVLLTELETTNRLNGPLGVIV